MKIKQFKLIKCILSLRFRHRRPVGARREDQLPLADVERCGQWDRPAAGRGKGHAHAGLVGTEDRIGEWECHQCFYVPSSIRIPRLDRRRISRYSTHYHEENTFDAIAQMRIWMNSESEVQKCTTRFHGFHRVQCFCTYTHSSNIKQSREGVECRD